MLSQGRPRGTLKTNEEGSVAIVFALTSLVVVGVVGAAIDFGRAIQARERLQIAVDQAAIAGASLPATANQNRITAATRIFNVNITGSGVSGVTPTITATNASVNVKASFSSPNLVLGLLGINTIDLTADSTARPQIQNGGVACLIALSETSDDGMHLQGINKVSSEDCWIWVNSNHAESINAVGASTGTAQGFCTVGGVVGADHFSPAPYSGCDKMADPFKDFMNSYSVSDTCTHTNLQLNNGTHTMSPGVYCGNTTIKPQAIVTMSPGLYVFKGGELEIQAGGEVTGDGVTLFFTHMGTKMTVRGGSKLTLKAPAAGDLAGFVIVDRKIDWYDSSIRESVFQGGGDLKIEGIMYTPQWKVNISGNGDINQTAQYFAIIADTVYMEGNGKLYINSDAEAAGLPNKMPKIKNGPLLLN